MAASPTPRPKPAEAGADPLLAPLQALDLPLPVAIAYSGGADSTALLATACRAWPGQVHAVHVHHGLQAAADGFEAHCVRFCAARQVPLHVVRVDARHAPGGSPEDAARRARYSALAQTASQHGLGAVLLAQHADDQAETLLLALGRGAGLPGISAMPAAFAREGTRFVRPWLDVPGPVIRERVQSDSLAFVDDPTNADERFTRNRIRRQVLPALAAAFPHFRETFARSARHAAEAQRLLDALAAGDLASMGGEPLLAGLQALPATRQANLLRHWLRAAHAQSASTAQLDELLDQVADATTRGHGLRLKVGRGVVLRDGPRLRFEAG